LRQIYLLIQISSLSSFLSRGLNPSLLVPAAPSRPFPCSEEEVGRTRADDVIFDLKTSLFTNNCCSAEVPHNISPSSLYSAPSFPLNGSWSLYQVFFLLSVLFILIFYCLVDQLCSFTLWSTIYHCSVVSYNPNSTSFQVKTDKHKRPSKPTDFYFKQSYWC
jgi:hypothetical protein